VIVGYHNFSASRWEFNIAVVLFRRDVFVIVVHYNLQIKKADNQHRREHDCPDEEECDPVNCEFWAGGVHGLRVAGTFAERSLVKGVVMNVR